MHTPKRSKSFLSQFFVTALGSAGGQGVLLLSVPVLTRLYSPTEFGIWALFMSACFANTVLAGLRYEISIVLAKNDRAAMAGIAVTVTVALITSVGMATLILLFHSHLFHLGFPVPVVHSLYFIPPLIVSTAMFQSGIFWWTRKHNFSRIAVARTAQSGVTIVSQIVLALMYQGSARYLIWGTVAGQLLSGTAVFCMLVTSDGVGLFQAMSLKRMRVVARRYWRLPLFTSLNTLGAQAYAQGIVVMLASFGGVAISGLYAVSYRSIYNPMQLLASSMGQVFFPRMARAGSTDAVERFIVRILGYLGVVLGAFAGVLMTYADSIAPWIFGSHWGGAAWVMKIMLWPAIFLVMTSVFERIYDVYNRQHLNFAIELGFNILALGGLAIGMLVLHSPEIGLVLLATIMSIGYGIWLLTAFIVAGFHLPKLAKCLGMFWVVAAVAWSGSMFMKYALETEFATALSIALIIIPFIVETKRLINYINQWELST